MTRHQKSDSPSPLIDVLVKKLSVYYKNIVAEKKTPRNRECFCA